MRRTPVLTERETKDLIIYGILVPSMLRLYEEDYFNICAGVSERNICARLSHHMEKQIRECHNTCLFDDYYVDVEYNRMGYGNLKYYENNKDELKYMVSDLLIHSRGKSPNYLAVEMKRKGNNKNTQNDKRRLKALVSSRPLNMENNCVYGTLVGAFITYSKDEATIALFEDFEGRGKETDMIRFDCSKYGKRGGIIVITKIKGEREELLEIHRNS